MQSSTVEEIEAERQRDEDDRRRRRETKHRRLAAAGSAAAAVGLAMLLIMGVYIAGDQVSPEAAELTGLLRVLSAILILGGAYTQLRSRASLRSEYRWAETVRHHRTQQAAMDALERKVDAATALIATMAHAGTAGVAVYRQLTDLDTRVEHAEETLAVIVPKIDSAYTNGFADGVGGAGPVGV